MKLKLLLVISFFISRTGFSHENWLDTSLLMKNEFMIRRTLHCFFDGAPVWQTLDERVPYGTFMNSAGIGFRRRISELNFLTTNVDFYRYYNCTSMRDIDTGSTLNRHFVEFRTDYSRLIPNTEQPLFLDLGLSFRSGTETLLEEYKEFGNGNHMLYVVSHEMKKFGISTGLTFLYLDWTKIRFHIQLKYTGYFSFGKSASLAYSSEYKPTSHVLNFGVILGFGK